MTKFCRDNQIEKINKIVNAVRIIENWHDYGAMEKALELLAQIQSAIILIGTVIEQDLQDYSLLVTKSEQICELLYQISESLEDDRRVEMLVDHTERKMIQLKEGLSVIHTRKEIVFLPYQVSMWDSLESVWLAAKEDKETDSYVVPIPFYDVLQNGSLGELHDQGADYPDYVPITSCEHYLLEERHPDVIFFHNPYDDFNTVTRVPEQYYSSQLKKCTEQLVYIPYYLSPGDGPSDDLCYMPGVLFADKVIVQPDGVYDTYCRVYTQALKEHGWERMLKPAGEKFLPLGSPKLDKLWNISCEIEDLPESWKKIILKPDGSKKKIVLYNLTIRALLTHNEQVIKKMESVFRLFQAKRDEVVLLWRPHPLLLSTINSMRPQLRDAYLKQVQKFKEEGWGIFDETPDANLAIALSDAYYGDWSSLVVAYETTGKPMIFHDLADMEGNDFSMEKLKESSKHKKRESFLGKTGSMAYHMVIADLP